MCIVTWLKNPTPNDEACDSLRSNTRRFSAFRSFISPVLSFTRHLEDSETKDSLAQDSTRVWCWDGGSFSDVSLPLFAYFSTFHNVQGWRLQIRVLPLKVETNLCYTDCHFTCLECVQCTHFERSIRGLTELPCPVTWCSVSVDHIQDSLHSYSTTEPSI